MSSPKRSRKRRSQKPEENTEQTQPTSPPRSRSRRSSSRQKAADQQALSGADTPSEQQPAANAAEEDATENPPADATADTPAEVSGDLPSAEAEVTTETEDVQIAAENVAAATEEQMQQDIGQEEHAHIGDEPPEDAGKEEAQLDEAPVAEDESEAPAAEVVQPGEAEPEVPAAEDESEASAAEVVQPGEAELAADQIDTTIVDDDMVVTVEHTPEEAAQIAANAEAALQEEPDSDALQEVVSQAEEVAARLEQVMNEAEQVVDQAAQQASAALASSGEQAQSLAQTMADNAPAGQMGDVTRSASAALGQGGRSMQHAGEEHMVERMVDVARRYPLRTAIGAIVVLFVLRQMFGRKKR